MKIQIEHTDTFGGEANYSWANRKEIELPDSASDLQIVRAAKREIGYSGYPCKRSDYGETIVLHPENECTVIFIDAIYD